MFLGGLPEAEYILHIAHFVFLWGKSSSAVTSAFDRPGGRILGQWADRERKRGGKGLARKGKYFGANGKQVNGKVGVDVSV